MKNLIPKITVIIITLFLASGCTQIEMMKKLNSGQAVIQGKTDITVPFDLRGHAIIVKVKINENPREYNFILDTGAITFINEETANELDLEQGIEVPTWNDTVKARLVETETISLGNAKVKNLTTVMFDFVKYTGFQKIDGFIGSDFLRFFKVTIDYNNRVLTLSHNTEPIESVDAGYLLEIEKPLPIRAPMVECEINETLTADAMIDLGSPHCVVLPLSLLDKLSGEDIPLIKSIGIVAQWPQSTTDESFLSRIESLKFGNLEIENIPVLIADVNDILLGEDFLSQFLITINYPAKQLLLLPLDNMRFKHNIFSTGLALEKDDDNRTVVKGFWEGSPADKSGIQVGDEIIEINSINVSELALFEISSILKDDTVQEIELLINTEPGEKKVILKKETLLPELK